MKHKPDWLPDWKDASQYPDSIAENFREIAWEFLRRNPEYWEAYEASGNTIAAVESLSTEEKANAFIIGKLPAEYSGQSCTIDQKRSSA
jgi:hypothetical protein